MSQEIRITSKGASTLQWKQLTPLQKNLKTLSDENYKKIRKQILELGFAEPIAVWNDKSQNLMYVLNGHQRLTAIKKMVNEEGFTCPPLPVSWVEAKTLSEAMKLVLSLGSSFGKTGPQGLHDFMGHAKISMQDVRDSFHFPEINMPLFEKKYGQPKRGKAPDPPAPPAVPVTKKMDLWILGDHKILCGDATSASDVKILMGEQRADMVLADPPYSVGYTGGSTNDKARDDTFKDKFSPEDHREFLTKFLSVAHIYSTKNAALHIWFGETMIAELTSALQGSGWNRRSLIIWNKLKAHYGALGRQYKSRFEPLYYCHKKGETPSWYGQTNEPSVWDCEQPHKNELHPTMKPVSLYEKSIENHTKTGDVVLECFSGSGTSIVACESMGRKCYALEVDPIFVDVAVRRWEEMTGKKAVPAGGLVDRGILEDV